MMNFCENCNCAFEQTRCPVCGSKKNREVNDNDFCLLAEVGRNGGEALMGVLQTNDIPCNSMPCGSGAESVFAMPLSNYRIYVPYCFLEKAKTVMRELEREATENLRAMLLENADKFNIAPRYEKKMRKKYKLQAVPSFVELCVDIVKNAEVIADKGPAMTPPGAHSVFCYSKDATLSINLLSFEIMFFTLNNKKH